MLHVTDSQLNARLLLRSLLPSLGSLVGCLLTGMALVGVHVLTLALNEQVMPFTHDDRDVILQAFSTYVVTPLQLVLHNNLLNTILVVLLWGVFAWLLFECLSQVSVAIAEWRTVRHNVVLPGGLGANPQRHPLQSSFVIRTLWQVGVLMLALGVTLAFLPLIRFVLMNEAHLFDALSAGAAFGKIILDICIWALIAHTYVVVLRWYMLRTRVFGEILY